MPKKPKPAPIRLIREGSMKFCPVCGSSYITRYKIFKIGIRKIEGCIQPECGMYNKEA
jgi:hypothetical protein